MAESLKQKTVRGTLWSAVERLATQAVQFVVMIVMARMLTPDDYGLVAMLAVFIAVAQSLVDSGFTQALIRKRDRTDTDCCTVFYFNIAAGVLLYLVFFASAPLIAGFYDEPVLVPLTRVICLCVIINSFALVQRALLTINIDFKPLAKASLLAAGLSGIIGIILAWQGAGVWAIVWQTLANLALNAALLWWFTAWRPRLLYSWASFRELFGFGSKLAGAGVIDTVYRNMYQLVIGKVFSAADLGYYTRAQQFAELPSSNLSGIIQRVTFPVLCTVSDDEARMADGYRRLLRFSAFAVFPLMMLLAAVARPLVEVLLPPRWAFAATLLSILCFQMMWYPIHAINLNLLNVVGRSDLFLKLEVWKKLIGVSLLAVTLPFGLVPLCWGSVGASLIALVINTHYTGRFIHVGFMQQIRDFMPALLNSLFSGAVAWFVASIIPGVYAALAAALAAGAACYLLTARLYGADELKELANIIKRK